VRYADAHAEASAMAHAAASTFELFGFESAVVPFDLCVEAQALGCSVDYRADEGAYLPPVVSAPLDLAAAPERLRVPDDVVHAGRVPVVAEAIRRLKSGVGREIAVGAWIPGPFTLAWQLFGTEAWLASLNATVRSTSLLATLADFLARVGRHYIEAGADFLTIHEMGGSPQVVGARRVRDLVLPGLMRLLGSLPSPKVLSMCGKTNDVVEDLAACGADALNVDHCNDLARSRAHVGGSAVLVGNLDPVGLLSQGTPGAIAQAVHAIAPHVNAIWPGCDLWPEIPDENFRALMDAARGCSRE
jgi:[methyl-Co(III) methanol-specific corrinoid protein]:coenzyme M methyltransferase